MSAEIQGILRKCRDTSSMPDLHAGIQYTARPARRLVNTTDVANGGYGSVENRFVIEHMEVRSDMDIGRIARSSMRSSGKRSGREHSCNNYLGGKGEKGTSSALRTSARKVSIDLL